MNNGIVLKNKLYSLRIRGFILDVPARSYINYAKDHSGYMSCTKYYTDGDFINIRVCFRTTKNILLRTDAELKQKVQEEN